jgi:6,7-dimethyl-8-ribityllumazine synthase
MAEPRRRATGFDNVRGARVLVVEGRFYEDVADALWTGAKRVLDEAGVTVERFSVPGALEIPQAIALAAGAAEHTGKPFDGVVALGCVIRGETSHYDIVAGESARALMDMAIGRALPIGNGILTVDTEAQANARASHNQRDKGGDAARAALSLIAVKRRLAASPGAK